MNTTLFHLAFPIGTIADAKRFYVDGLGCEPGRETPQALILNLYGHQLVGHITAEPLVPQKGIYPRHFGLIFTEEADWEALLARSRTHHLPFVQAPKERFPGTPLEHRTFFLQDPFGNYLEFKFYRHASAIFGETGVGAIGDRTSATDPTPAEPAPSALQP